MVMINNNSNSNDRENGKMHPTQQHTTTDDEPILDPVLQEQLRKEIYGGGVRGDPPVATFEAGTNANANEKARNFTTTGGMMVMGASILGLVGMQFPFLFIKHAPFMATPSRKVRDALTFILENNNRHKRTIAMPSTSIQRSSWLQQQRAPKNPASTRASPPVFVDLGSGDGQAVYEAAKLGYRAVGIEFNWTLWALSSFRRQFFWSLDAKRRSQFLLQDFSNYNLKDADTVMIFAVPRTMPILGQKIQSECSPGTNVMAYRFEMPLADADVSATTNETCTTISSEEPTTTTETEGQDNDYVEVSDLRLQAKCIYDQEEMRIYRMGE